MSEQTKRVNGIPTGGFGRIISDARVAHTGLKLGREDLSKLTGISASSIESIEMNRRVPSKNQCMALAAALNLHPKDLWERRNDCKARRDMAEVKFNLHYDDAALIQRAHGVTPKELAKRLIGAHLVELRKLAPAS